MKKLYIKFEEWNQASLDKAVEEAKRLWYKEYWNFDALHFEWNWILELDKDYRYFTSRYSEQELITKWYIEYRIINYVYVSDISVEDAKKKKEKRILLHTLPWKAKYPYIVVCWGRETQFLNWEDYDTDRYKYIAEIEEETIKIGENTYNKKDIEERLKDLKPINK